jgi:ribosomal protein S18 acetylase RimI-like enzyme
MTEAAFRLRRSLAGEIQPPAWPPGYSCRTLQTADAIAVHALLRTAYAQGAGVADFAQWWPRLSGDAEFDPQPCFLVWGPEGVVGVALCWTSAFLKDLAVHPTARGQGIGTNLLLQVFTTFRERGAPHVDLKVEAGNDGAIRLYDRMGMYRVPLAG